MTELVLSAQGIFKFRLHLHLIFTRQRDDSSALFLAVSWKHIMAPVRIVIHTILFPL